MMTTPTASALNAMANRSILVTSHLENAHMGYLKHARHAFSLSFKLMRLSLLGMIHAVLPHYCRQEMSNGVEKVKFLIWKDKERVRRAKQRKRGLVNG